MFGIIRLLKFAKAVGISSILLKFSFVCPWLSEREQLFVCLKIILPLFWNSSLCLLAQLSIRVCILHLFVWVFCIFWIRVLCWICVLHVSFLSSWLVFLLHLWCFWKTEILIYFSHYLYYAVHRWQLLHSLTETALTLGRPISSAREANTSKRE